MPVASDDEAGGMPVNGGLVDLMDAFDKGL